MFDVVVGIIHHSRIDLTISCIESICEPRLKIQICLIDNNPQERIKQLIAGKFPNVDIVVNNYPKGFGFNQNVIMERYNGQYRAFMTLNNDTILKPDAIILLFDYLFKDESIGAVCPQMVDKHNNPQASHGPIPSTTTHVLRIVKLKKILKIEFVERVLYKYIKLLPNFVKQYLNAKKGYVSTSEIPRISGACVLFKEKAIRDVGGYDESFYMYSEDSDWSIRAKQKKYFLYIVTPAKVMHHVGASSSVKTKIELEKSMFLYIEKHQSRSKWIIVPSIALLLVCIHTVQYVWCLLGLKSTQDKMVHKNIIWLGLKKILKFN